MGDLFGIGATVQGAAQASAAGLNYASQMDYNNKYLQGVQETNATNKELAEKQNEWNLAQWHRENAYNDPAKQVERLRAAGLSAAAAAQSIEGAGNASPMQSANLANQVAPQPLQAPQLDVSGMNLIGVARALEDLRQSKLQTKTMENEVKAQPDRLYTEQQIREQNLKIMQQDYEQAAKENPYKLEVLKNNKEIQEQTKARNKIELKIAKQTLKEMRQKYGFLEKYNEQQLKEIFETISKIKLEKTVLGKQSKLLDQDIAIKEIKKAFEKYGGTPDNFAACLAIMVAEDIIKPEDVAGNVEKFQNVIKYLRDGVKSYLPPNVVKILDVLCGDEIDEPETLIPDELTNNKVPIKKRKNFNNFGKPFNSP